MHVCAENRVDLSRVQLPQRMAGLAAKKFGQTRAADEQLSELPEPRVPYGLLPGSASAADRIREFRDGLREVRLFPDESIFDEVELVRRKQRERPPMSQGTFMGNEMHEWGMAVAGRWRSFSERGRYTPPYS